MINNKAKLLFVICTTKFPIEKSSVHFETIDKSDETTLPDQPKGKDKHKGKTSLKTSLKSDQIDISSFDDYDKSKTWLSWIAQL